MKKNTNREREIQNFDFGIKFVGIDSFFKNKRDQK